MSRTIFWHEIITGKDKTYKGVKIDNSLMLDFLGELGLKKYRIGNIADSTFVYKEGLFWEIVNEESIKDIAIKAIKTCFADYEHVMDVINKLNGVNNMFKRGFLSGLRTAKINAIIDTHDKSFNYYRNGVVIVDGGGGVSMTGYDELKDVDIWKSTVIDRDFNIDTHNNLDTRQLYDALMLSGGKESIIETFLKTITADDITFEAIKSSIGYLMHRYKSESLTKLTSLTDTDFDADASGGNGKSLISKILGQVRNVYTINHDVGGKMKEFVFGNVRADVDIVFHDELPRGFKLGRIFTAVTGDLTTEKKGKDVKVMPFEISPKHLSASNHPFEGTGGSFSGRLNEIQINHYYERDKRQPKDDFGGKEFFKHDFGPNEWILFDAFMIDCLGLYMRDGIIRATNETITESKLILNTNEGFCMFLDDLGFGSDGAKFTVKRMVAEFLQSQDVIKNLNVNTTVKWVKEWGKARGFAIEKEREGGGERRRYLKLGGGGADVWSEFGGLLGNESPF